MRELGNNLDLIKEFGCDDVVLRQVLRQLIYFIVSISLNQLLGKILTFPVRAPRTHSQPSRLQSAD